MLKELKMEHLISLYLDRERVLTYQKKTNLDWELDSTLLCVNFLWESRPGTWYCYIYILFPYLWLAFSCLDRKVVCAPLTEKVAARQKTAVVSDQALGCGFCVPQGVTGSILPPFCQMIAVPRRHFSASFPNCCGLHHSCWSTSSYSPLWLLIVSVMVAKYCWK